MTKTRVLYPPEVREQSVAMVFDTRTPQESLKAACTRVAPLVNVKFATLYNWCKQARAVVDVPARKAQTVGELEAEVRALRKELRETKRANEILKAGGCRTNPDHPARVSLRARGLWDGVQLRSVRPGSADVDAAIGGRLAA